MGVWNCIFILHNKQKIVSILKKISTFFLSEFNEVFELQLIGATGGAILGAQLIARITIAKSDSPNGVVRFINQSAITIPNPNSTVRLSLFAERADGLLGDAMVRPCLDYELTLLMHRAIQYQFLYMCDLK